jgi:UDP-N-acetyl-2-amino-2-deoxyglucuronate dehydrogenase
MDGGAFMNQASHYVDMVDWLVGPVDSVHAYTATLARNIEAEDTGVMSLRLRNGGWRSINVTMLAHGRRTSKAASPSWARRAPCASAVWP